MKTIFYLIVILIFASCNINDKKTNNTSSYIEITDTIVFKNTLEFNLTDFKNNRFLGYDYYSKQIICYAKDGSQIFRFKKIGGAEFEYQNISDVKFYTDTTIVILTGNQVKEYNFEGKYKKTIFWDNVPPQYPRNFLEIKVIQKDTFVFYRVERGGFTGDPKFYTDTNRKYITGANITNPKRYNLVKFEKNSIYLNGEEYYQQTTPVFTFNKTGDSVFVIFPHETKLYKYSVFNENLSSCVSFNSKVFKKPIGTKFGQTEDGFKLFQINSYYFKLFNSNDTIFALLYPGVNEEEVCETITELNKVEDELYLDILLSSGKLIDEIKLPKGISSIATIVSSNEIYFYKYQSQEEVDSRNSYFLKGKIVYNK